MKDYVFKSYKDFLDYSFSDSRIEEMLEEYANTTLEYDYPTEEEIDQMYAQHISRDIDA